MDKVNAIKDFLVKQNFDNVIALHNDWCEKNKYVDMIIYPMTTDNINMFFGTSAHLFMAIKCSERFDINAKYFRLVYGQIRTDITTDFDALVEHLIDWGDSKFNFDITEHLEKAFKEMAISEYENGVREGNFSREQIEKEIDQMDNDYLMEDWNDLSFQLWECLCCSA